MKTIMNQLTGLKRTIAICLFSISFGSFGQQLYYSQFQLTPMLNNPSLITVSDELKVDIGYRNQFGGKGANYATPVFSASMPFSQEIGRDVYKKFGAGGLQVLTDRTGNGGLIATTGFSLTYAHIAHLTQTDWISFGLQPGVFQRRVDFSKLTSGTQWNEFTGAYGGGDLGENISDTERKTFFTLNTGATYVKENLRGDPFLVIGVAANNLTRPNISLNNKTFSNPVNWNFQASVLAFENQQIIVKPSVRHIQVRNVNQTNIGSQVYYKIPDMKGFFGKGSIGLGLWYSNQNAIITALEINQKSWAIGFSYDILASTLADANNSTGAPEIIVGFRKAFGRSKKGSFDNNATDDLGSGGKGGGKLKDPQKASGTKTEINPEQELKPGDGKSGEDNKPAVDREQNTQKDEKPALPLKEVEEKKEEAPVNTPKGVEAAKEEANPANPNATDKPSATKSNAKRSTKPGLKSNLSPELTERLSKILTPNEDMGDDPYAGTPLALTQKQKDVFRKQPRYAKGGVEIDDVTKAQVSQIVKIMKSRPKLKLEINGFGCDLGGPEVNKIITLARAEKVKKFFLSKGIPSGRLTTKANGLEKPRAENTSEDGRAANRRVEFKFIP